MNQDFMDILSHAKEGYLPLVDYGAWRVAVLNYIEKYAPGNIAMMDKHLETDEVFVLLSGSCKLLIAGNGGSPGPVKGYWMETGKVYNIHKGVWHSHILLPGSSVLVVENADTNTGNTSSAPIDNKESIL